MTAFLVGPYSTENDRLGIASRAMGACPTNRRYACGQKRSCALGNRGCYVVREVMSTAGKGVILHFVNTTLQNNYWLCFELCGRSERAINASPPTSRISMTIVLNRLVG